MPRGFTVIDFETTGLAPSRGDRVIELGAICMDPALNIVSGLETLINPRRDVGPTHIHGVTARDVFDAPTFDRVAPSLLEILEGRVIVGHNVAFDLRFLAAELERDGYEIPDFVAIDTLQVAKSLLSRDDLPTFQLHDIAAHLGFGIDDVLEHAGLSDRPEHSALGDALVTAYVFARLVEMSAGSAFWDSHLERAAELIWPEYVPVAVEAKRRGEASGVSKLSSQSPASLSVGAVFKALGAEGPGGHATSEYARLLDESLADRILDAAEIDVLVSTARVLRLDNATLGSLHRGHFDRVVTAAWSDGSLYPEERADIVRLAELLGIDDHSLRAALQEEPEDGGLSSEPAYAAIAAGSLIVLTGDMSAPRAELEEKILSLGFIVGKNVTKKTSLVIAADPYTQSGKARKARDYGIAVLGEEEGFAFLSAQCALQPVE